MQLIWRISDQRFGDRRDQPMIEFVMPTTTLSAQIEQEPDPFVPQPDNRLPSSIAVRIGHPIDAVIHVDLRHAITAAVAQRLWEQFAGNSVINWLQAEAIVDNLSLAPATTQPVAHTDNAPEQIAEPKPLAKRRHVANAAA
jgi:hypothetical protein